MDCHRHATGALRRGRQAGWEGRVVVIPTESGIRAGSDEKRHEPNTPEHQSETPAKARPLVWMGESPGERARRARESRRFTERRGPADADYETGPEPADCEDHGGRNQEAVDARDRPPAHKSHDHDSSTCEHGEARDNGGVPRDALCRRSPLHHSIIGHAARHMAPIGPGACVVSMRATVR